MMMSNELIMSNDLTLKGDQSYLNCIITFLRQKARDMAMKQKAKNRQTFTNSPFIHIIRKDKNIRNYSMRATWKQTITIKFSPVYFGIRHSRYLWTFCQELSLHKKMKFYIKDFFSKCDQIRRFPRICSHLLKKFFMENFIFCAVCPAKFHETDR